MSRTLKSTSKSEAAKAAYEPTIKDRNTALAMVQKHEAASPQVRLAVRQKNNIVGIGTDHQDEGIGQMHLMAAMGLTDALACASILSDLVNLATTDGKTSEKTLNGLLAIVREIGPKDATETLLAIQMTAIHNATITAARRLMHAEMRPQGDNASNALNKLARTFTTQVEALKKYRSDGQQTIKVTHVAVNEGGQAIVGNVRTGGGVPAKKEHQPHEPSCGSEPSPALLGNEQALGQPLPSAGTEGLERVPLSRCAGRSSNGQS